MCHLLRLICRTTNCFSIWLGLCNVQATCWPCTVTQSHLRCANCACQRICILLRHNFHRLQVTSVHPTESGTPDTELSQATVAAHRHSCHVEPYFHLPPGLCGVGRSQGVFPQLFHLQYRHRQVQASKTRLRSQAQDTTVPYSCYFTRWPCPLCAQCEVGWGPNAAGVCVPCSSVNPQCDSCGDDVNTCWTVRDACLLLLAGC